MTIRKIAIAAVAALTLSTLAIPASAAINANLSVNNEVVNASNPASPVLLPVPEDGYIDAEDTLKVVVSDLANNTAVSVTAQNAFIVSALDADNAPVTHTSGSSAYTGNSLATNSVTFYVYTKTTVAGSVAVTVGGNTNTYYVKGIAGSLKTLGLVAPASGIGEKNVNVTVTGTDAFGNATVAGATMALNTNGIVTTSGVVTGTEYTLVLPFDGTLVVSVYASGVVQASKTIIARNLLAELADKSTTIAGLETQIAVLNAKIASLTADAANAKVASDSTIAGLNATIVGLKTDYNVLAKKWNIKFPKQKVRGKF